MQNAPCVLSWCSSELQSLTTDDSTYKNRCCLSSWQPDVREHKVSTGKRNEWRNNCGNCWRHDATRCCCFHPREVHSALTQGFRHSFEHKLLFSYCRAWSRRQNYKYSDTNQTTIANQGRTKPYKCHMLISHLFREHSEYMSLRT